MALFLTVACRGNVSIRQHCCSCASQAALPPQ
jgi:hypothetical protein